MKPFFKKYGLYFILFFAAWGLAFLACPPKLDRSPEDALKAAFDAGLLPVGLETDMTPLYRMSQKDMIKLCEKNFTPRVESEDKFLGFDVWAMRIKANRKHTPWVQFWVDKRTMKPLYVREWSGDNKIIGAKVPVPVNHEAVSGDLGAALDSVRNILPKAKLPKTVAGYLKPVRVAADEAGKSACATYSDGVTCLSLYLDDAKHKPRSGDARKTLAGVRYTLTGNIPPTDLTTLLAEIK